MTGAEIAETLGMPPSTVSGILTRIGLGKLGRLEPLEPPNRYERKRPGELVHVDVKKLGRIGRPGHRVTGRVSGGGHHRRAFHLGWEYVHVCVDDATRLVYVEVLDDEKALTAVGFLRRAVAHFAAFGIRVERLMTDNGSAYRATIHALACKALGIKHLRTQPYRPRTNGKAERFIRTMLGGWAYAAIYRNTDDRRRAHSPAGSTSTIDNDHTAASAAKPRSNAYTRSTGTTSSGPTTRSRTRSRLFKDQDMAPNKRCPWVRYGSTGLIRGEPSLRRVASRATRAWSRRCFPRSAISGAAVSRSRQFIPSRLRLGDACR
jgi:transposase InsO family protein